MKKLRVFFLFILSLLWQPGALALEGSTTVKVATVLKTESSWDGKPIEYPSGKAEVTGLVIAADAVHSAAPLTLDLDEEEVFLH